MSYDATHIEFPRVIVETEDATIRLLDGDNGFAIAADSGDDTVLVDTAVLALINRLRAARDDSE